MRISDFSSVSKINEQDYLIGEQKVSKTKYRHKKFKMSDLANFFKSGLSEQQGGSLKILMIEQEDEPFETPRDLINNYEKGLYIPPYCIVMVRMKQAGKLYMFTRNNDTFGMNASWANSEDFILLYSTERPQIEETESFRIEERHNGADVFLKPEDDIIVDINWLPDGFKCKLFNLSDFNIIVEGGANKIHIPKYKSVQVVKRKEDKQTYLFG